MKKTWLLIISFLISLHFYGQQEWKQTVIDNSLTVSAPFELKPLDLELGEDTKKMLDRNNAFNFILILSLNK